MTNNPAGLLPILAFFVAAVGSVPLVLGTFLLSRWVRPFSRALVYAGGAITALAAVLAVIVATISPEAGVIVAVVAVVAGTILWVIPLLVARAILVQRGLDAQRSLRTAMVGLPIALVASLFVVFGDFSRYNITFLTGVEAAVAWTALAGIVLLGPTVVALAIERVR